MSEICPPAKRDPKHVFIGVPITGNPAWEVPETIERLKERPNQWGWKFTSVRMSGQYVGHARNMLTEAARRTSASKLVMLDADHVLGTDHVYRLLTHNVHVVGALYPKKQCALEWAGEFLPLTKESMGPGGLWPIVGLGTGMCSIDMSVIDKSIHKAQQEFDMNETGRPTFYETPEGWAGVPVGTKVYDLWGVGPVIGEWYGRKFSRFLYEDYFFSDRWVRGCRGQMWVDPLCRLGHLGTVDYLQLQNEIAEARFKASLQAQNPPLTGAAFEEMLRRGREVEYSR